MKHLFIMVLLFTGLIYGQEELSDPYANPYNLHGQDSTKAYFKVINWGGLYVDTVGTPDIHKILIDESRVVWDSLGYVKITTATKIRFRTVSQWKLYYGDDSVWYLRNNERWFVKPLMEIK